MKKQTLMIAVLTLSLIVITAPLFAQGKGIGIGVGNKTQVGAGANTHVKTDTSADVKTEKKSGVSETHGKTHEQTTVASKIEAKPQLAAKVTALLPAGMTLADAAKGFRNQGQFIAALHVSQNLNIPFDQLKAKMTGSDSMSLGAAIHALRPDLKEDQTKTEVKRAETQTKATTSTTTTTNTKS